MHLLILSAWKGLPLREASPVRSTGQTSDRIGAQARKA
jgi:hypothetical protein